MEKTVILWFNQINKAEVASQGEFVKGHKNACLHIGLSLNNKLWDLIKVTSNVMSQKVKILLLHSLISVTKVFKSYKQVLDWPVDDEFYKH